MRDRTQARARRHCHYARSELTKTVGQRPPAQSRCRSPPVPIAEESDGSLSVPLSRSIISLFTSHINHLHTPFYKQHNKMIYCLQYSQLLTTILQMRNNQRTRGNNKNLWELRSSSHQVSRKLTRNRSS